MPIQGFKRQFRCNKICLRCGLWDRRRANNTLLLVAVNSNEHGRRPSCSVSTLTESHGFINRRQCRAGRGATKCGASPWLLLLSRARVVPGFGQLPVYPQPVPHARENPHREDNGLAREGKSLQHRLKPFYLCFLLSFYLLFLMWLAGLPLFCSSGAEC